MIGEPQELADGFQKKATAVADERQPIDMPLIGAPLVAGGACRRRDNADLLVLVIWN